MRLSLAAMTAMALVAGGCRATHNANSRLHLYADERITVISPALHDELEAHGSTVTADYVVDVVSCATQVLTVDAVSSATRFEETRHQAGLTAAHALSPETELSGGYTFSAEPDHVVHAPSIGLAQELMERMVRASVRYQLLAEAIGRVDDPSFSEGALGHRIDLGWTQILTRSLTLTALATTTAYGCGASTGCFANPYRFVGLELGEDRIGISERHPASRFTAAGALRVSWAFADSSALHAGYRLAGDSWEVTAHSVDASVASELFSGRLLLRGEARATVQDGASFYRPRYAGSAGAIPAYRTADAELSSLWNVRVQLHLEWGWGPLRLVGQVGRMWNRYPDFPSLPARDAWVGGIGVDADL